MPRIAASLVAIATLAFCIGWNTVRYPIVWEMVAPNRLAPARESAKTQTAAEGEATAQPADQTGPLPGAANIQGPAGDAAAEQLAAEHVPQEADAAASPVTAGNDPAARQEGSESTGDASYVAVAQRPNTTGANTPCLSADYTGYAGFANGSFLPATSGYLSRPQCSRTRSMQTTRGEAESQSGNANYWPAEVVPSTKYAAGVGTGSSPLARESDLPMVPIVRNDGTRAPGMTPTPSPSPASSVAAGVTLVGQMLDRIERLPPVDQVTTLPSSGLSVLSTPPAAYPRTGL